MNLDFPVPPELNDPLLGFRFAVVFLGLPPHLLDFRFQSVEGLSRGIELESLANQGGTHARRYPLKRKAGELILKRGLSTISTYRWELQTSFTNFKFKPRNVLVTVFDENWLPVSNWIFYEAYTIDWSLTGVDASANQVIIETMKLTYANVKSISL